MLTTVLTFLCVKVFIQSNLVVLLACFFEVEGMGALLKSIDYGHEQ